MAFIAATTEQETGREPDQEDEFTTLTRLRKMGQEAVSHDVNRLWREDAAEAYRYEAGIQWTAEELEILRQRKQPPTVENRIRKQRRTFMGLYHKLRLKASFLGRNLALDEDTANAFNDLNLYWSQRNDYAAHEARAVRDHWIGGLGWMETGVRVAQDGRPDLFGKWEDPFCLWRDPYGMERDLSDWRYVMRSKWVDLDVAAALYPEKAQQLRLQVGADLQSQDGFMDLQDPDWQWQKEWNWFDRSRDRLRLAEVWYRRKALRPVLIQPDGTRMVLDFGPEREMRRLAKANQLPVQVVPVDEVWVGIFAGNLIVHHDLSPYDHGDLPFTCFLYDLLPNGQAVGWVTKDLMSLQEAHNKRHSKALHLLSTNRAVYTESAIRDNHQLAQQMADPEGHIQLEGGGTVHDKFQIISNTELGQSQLALYQHVRASFDDAGGVSEVQQGAAPGEVRSDRGLQRLEMNAVGQDAEIFAHIKAARRRNLLLQTSNIQKFMSGDYILQVTEDEGIVRSVQMSSQQVGYLKNFSIDLSMTEEFEYANANQQAVDELMKLIPQVIQFGVPWARLMVELSNIKAKKKVLAILDQMAQQPPSVDPKVSVGLKWEELTPLEKGSFAIKFGMMELAQALMEQEGMTATDKKLLNDQLKQASKERMENQRMALKAVELEVKADQVEKQRSLDALTASAQEATKILVANRQAQARPSSTKG